jgi:hypothetical protein
MVRGMKKVSLGNVFVGFVVILVVIALVKYMVPSMDGFRDVSCYGVKCDEGSFCQENVCRPINPPYSNNYYNKGEEAFQSGGECPPGEEKDASNNCVQTM